jgi:hypothetical protein
MLATFFSQPVVWSTSLIELLTLLSVLTLAVGAYRHIECHHSGCHRIGRFPHGHYKLCRVHHPNVPTSGPIDGARIEEAVQLAKAAAPEAPSERINSSATRTFALVNDSRVDARRGLVRARWLVYRPDFCA